MHLVQEDQLAIEIKNFFDIYTLLFYLFNYLWLLGVFIATRGPSLVGRTTVLRSEPGWAYAPHYSPRNLLVDQPVPAPPGCGWEASYTLYP